jgi:hypothetical protein
MPFGGLLTAGLGSAFGGLAGLFGGGKQQKVQTNGTITNNQSGNFNTNTNNTTSPNFSPLQKALMQQFTSGATNLYNESTNLQPYESSGMEQINQGANAAGQAIAANNASRGLTFSPAGTTATNQNTLNRVNQQTQLANSIPLLQRQLQQQSLQQLMQAFQVIPTGQTQTGSQSGSTTQNSTQTQEGTNLVSGNPTAGLFSGLGAGTLASLPLLSQNMNWGNNGGETQSVYDPATSPNGDINQESYDPTLFQPNYGGA